MRFLHISDTHLGHRRWGLPEREKDFYDVFSEIVDIAIRENVEAVLHGGDMFDKPDPPPQTYIKVYEELSRLRDQGIRFYVVAGNHDLPTIIKRSPLEFFERVGLLRLLSLDTPGSDSFVDRDGVEIEIHGFSKRCSNDFFDKRINVKNEKKILRVALVHTLSCEPFLHIYGWSESFCQERGLRKLNSAINTSYFKYIALGDLHISWETRIGDSIAVYPGSPEALDRGEAFDRNFMFIDRYVYVVDLKIDRVEVKKIKLERARPWIYVQGADYKEVLNKINNYQWSRYKKPPILVVEIKKNLSSAERDYLNKELGKLIDSGRIFRYDIVFPERGEELYTSIAREGYGAKIETPSIESVLRDLFKDPGLVALLNDFIEERINERDLVKRLRENKDLLENLDSAIKSLRV
ncbi:MAG: DNA repair exonuclease [Sulfolobales archaeon]